MSGPRNTTREIPQYDLATKRYSDHIRQTKGLMGSETCGLKCGDFGKFMPNWARETASGLDQHDMHTCTDEGTSYGQHNILKSVPNTGSASAQRLSPNQAHEAQQLQLIFQLRTLHYPT